jgi:hypothetical protein
MMTTYTTTPMRWMMTLNPKVGKISRCIYILVAVCLCVSVCVPTSYGQTTVNLSVSDLPDGQTWNNGTWTVQLQPGPGNLSQTRSFTLQSGGGSLANQSGSLSGTGTAVISLPANANISPTTFWQFTVCPQASSGCFQQSVTVTVSSPQTLTINPPSVRINLATATPPVSAYATGEISSAVLGSQFFLIGTGQQFCSAVSGNTCTTWGGSPANGLTGPGSITGTFTGGPSCPIATATESGQTVTITTVSPCALGVGNVVTITGVSVAGYNNSAVAGNPPGWTLQTWSGSAGTYVNYTSGLGAATGGTITGSPNFAGNILSTGLEVTGNGLPLTSVAPWNLGNYCGSAATPITTGSVQNGTPCTTTSMFYAQPQSFNGFGQAVHRTDLITGAGVDVQSAVASYNAAQCNGNNSVGFANDNRTNCLAEVAIAYQTGATSSVNLIGFDALATSLYTGTGTHTVQASQLLTNSQRTPVWANNTTGDYSSTQTNLIQGGSLDLTLGLGIDSSSAGKGFRIGEYVASTKNAAHAVLAGQTTPSYGYWCGVSVTACHFIGANAGFATNGLNAPTYALQPLYAQIIAEQGANAASSLPEAFLSTGASTPCALSAASEVGEVITFTCNAGISAPFAVNNPVHVTGMTPSGYNGDYVIQSVATPAFTVNTSTYNLGAGTIFGTAAASARQGWNRYQDTNARMHHTFCNPFSFTVLCSTDVYAVDTNGSFFVFGTTPNINLQGTNTGRFTSDASGIAVVSDTNAKAIRFFTNNGSLNEVARFDSNKNFLATVINNTEGTPCASGNIVITGWGTGASTGTYSGFSSNCVLTITAGTTPSANPTIAFTFPNAYTTAPTGAFAIQQGGTGIIADLTRSVGPSTTAVTYQWNATPTSAATYIILLGVSP